VVRRALIAALLAATACSSPRVLADPPSPGRTAQATTEAEIRALLLVIADQNLTAANRRFLCAVLLSKGARAYLQCERVGPPVPVPSP
jgi:hypothetical protein